MKTELTYIENNLKRISLLYPQYYSHILTPRELSNFIFMLREKYSELADKDTIISEGKELVSGDFFEENISNLSFNQKEFKDINDYRDSFESQSEKYYFKKGFDISVSRVIRYMPAQWHSSSYFRIFHATDEECEISFQNSSPVKLDKGKLLIVAPDVQIATPCYGDGQCLDYFLLRKSSFDRVFFEQMNDSSIMSHFFRNALNSGNNKNMFILFDVEEDKDIETLMETIKKEIHQDLPFSSSLVNSLMSVLFSITLRRYENTAIIPSDNTFQWKKRFSGIFTYIQKNYDHASIEDVAEECSYSTKQISRIIRNHFHMSYKEFVTFLRMEKALALLKEGTMNMEEISKALGYGDTSSFFRAFKKYYKDTPVHYQKCSRQIGETSDA